MEQANLRVLPSEARLRSEHRKSTAQRMLQSAEKLTELQSGLDDLLGLENGAIRIRGTATAPLAR